MTFEERNEITKNIMNEVLKMAEIKGREYSSDEDSLSNFKRNAKKLGLTKYQVWAIYFMKHIDSINNAIKNNPSNILNEFVSESLESRIIDSITYLVILKCLVEEDKLF